MTTPLPTIISAYLAASDAGRVDAIILVFTDDAVVAPGVARPSTRRECHPHRRARPPPAPRHRHAVAHRPRRHRGVVPPHRPPPRRPLPPGCRRRTSRIDHDLPPALRHHGRLPRPTR